MGISFWFHHDPPLALGSARAGLPVLLHLTARAQKGQQRLAELPTLRSEYGGRFQ